MTLFEYFSKHQGSFQLESDEEISNNGDGMDCYDELHNENGTSYLPYDPDIEGLGPLLGFTIVTVVSTILLTVHYVSSSDESSASLYHNPIDRRFRRFISSRCCFRTRLSAPTTAILERVALNLSDTQLVTGIAILVSAWAQFSQIRLYHWQLAWQLAWLASVSHLAS